MRKRILIPGTVICGCILMMVFTGVGAPLLASDQNDIDLVVQGNNAFAIDLYAKIAKDKGNLFFSPYSISSAVAMTYAGARGETAGQIAGAFHFNLSAEKLHPAFSGLMASFNATGKSYELAVANGLWGQTGYKFQPEFLEIIGKYYEAGFKEVDYIEDGHREEARQSINKWVEEKTHDKIKNLIKPKVLNELTRLVLTNAIYFKGKWERQFKTENTTKLPFFSGAKKTPKIPMMHQTAKFKYTENEQAQILEMPYSGGDLAMDVILPRPNCGLKNLEKALPVNLQSWLSGVTEQEVKVYLPRFKLETEFLLNEKLRELGMSDAFIEDKADFSGISSSSKLYITKVIHKAFVEVNEEGTEASAATAIIVGIKAGPPQEMPVFRADRPFIFLIRDLRSGSILFIGRMVEP